MFNDKYIKIFKEVSDCTRIYFFLYIKYIINDVL